MTFLSEMDEATGLLDEAKVVDKGRDLRKSYLDADPFPHIAIDDFLPEPILERCLAEFPTDTSGVTDTYDRKQERFKRAFTPDVLPSFSRNLFYAFNSRPFIQVVENISGIQGLIPDPFFEGGGYHELSQGGHLSVHADFNYHQRLHVERRINVLIYLNRDWKDEYGAQLELWDTDMKSRVKSYVPAFNRCVIFSTTSDSNHGNPQPVNHPDGVSRRSIALYYYTATWNNAKRKHTTHFRVRPGEANDAPDVRSRSQDMLGDLMPPVLYRRLINLGTRKARR
ncbi:2OG-Fe(II) oxygenase [Mycobacterium sp.]|uniref:2OG-Fe(II) oxygenase n=1 Tax=Mycobacterium sp. TaxID=1785 RepID=UPI002CE53461|nr:2OG-Fe(II) oxygenase [Mycobacterium sp.]HKP41730.1 2OG-Fe(II) oxygenase [Mycobacterium sp.]